MQQNPHSDLYELIKNIERGTNLHVGVLFFGSYGNSKLTLPFSHQMHSSPVCDEFKRLYGDYRRCLKCRTAAIRKAVNGKRAYGGFCINGVYEYIHPVIFRSDVCAAVFVGNIIATDRGRQRLINNLRREDLLSEMQSDFTVEDCRSVARVIDSYIRFILETYGSRGGGDFDPLVENVKSFIEDNLEYPIDAPTVAVNFGYNRKYLGRLFKSKCGSSIDEYVTARRIKRAKRLLLDSDAAVTEIASKVGFNSISYFNRCFKRSTDLTPTQWRKSNTKTKNKDEM